ncbi:MAG: O-antigen ligase family protein [Anaerolineales bacterium]|nr:O-antigen ligase family protein [Anaerolineales bacterium]
MKPLLTALILLLATFGGLQFYRPETMPFFLAGGTVVAVLGLFKLATGQVEIDLVYVLGLLAVQLSLIANLDIWPVAFGRFVLVLLALATLVVARSVGSEELRTAIEWAGWGYPLVLLLAPGNPNIQAVWPVVFLLVSARSLAIDGRFTKWLYAALHFGALLWLGSRGALIGLAVGSLLLYRPRLNRFSVTGVVFGVGAALAVRPHTALNRLAYWHEALAAWSQSPLLGVGPGGLWARSLIQEPGGGQQIHAHNILITTLAELGLPGLIALLCLAYHLYRSVFQPWQTALIAAFAAWSLVDEPLFWPGPLLLLALVVGCRQKV